MTSHEHTLVLARDLGFKIQHIDDDCFLIKGHEVAVQVTYDNYKPSSAFVDATVMTSDGYKCFGSYGSVRAFLALTAVA